MGKALVDYGCQVCIRIKTERENHKEKVEILYIDKTFKSGLHAIKNWTFTFDLNKPGFASIGHHEIYQHIPL